MKLYRELAYHFISITTHLNDPLAASDRVSAGKISLRPIRAGFI
jgi:hypothetical protein